MTEVLGPVEEQAVSIGGPEATVVQLPLDEVRIETVELDSDTQHLVELGRRLEYAAQQVVKHGDGITARVRETLSAPAAVAAPLVGFVAVTAGNAVSGLPVSYKLGAIFGMTGFAAAQWSRSRKLGRMVAPIQIPEGYSIQCLRANQTSAAFDEREAVAFVHTRTYEDGNKQTVDQARDRLRDALEVIEEAPTVTRVVLPTSALREARLPLRDGKPYGDRVLDMKLDAWVDTPYKDSEYSVVLNREAAKRLAETLQHTQKHPVLNRTIDALAERFPLVRLQLAEAASDNDRLVPLLHTLLRRTLDGELPGAQRERGHETVLRKMSSAEVAAMLQGVDVKGWTISQIQAIVPPEYKNVAYDRSVPLLTQVDATDAFDPLITQRRATNFAPVETKRLSQMTGDEERLMADVLERLESRGYSDMQLIAVALRLAERRHKERSADAPADTQQPEVDPLVGGDPTAINANSKKHPAKRELRARLWGRMAVAGIMGGFLAQGPAIGTEALLSRLPDDITIPAADVEWRVDEHGMTSAGYYTKVAYDHFDATKVQWDGQAAFKWAEPLPAALADPNQAHLTISGLTTSGIVDLAIRQGTMLSALSAQTLDGTLIKSDVYIRPDSTRTVYVQNGGAPYKLSYILTEDWQRSRQPYADRTLKVTDPHWEDIDPSLFPRSNKRKSWGSVYYQSQHIANNFTYDASPRLRDKLAATRTANDYLHTVYDGGRCDCVECATAAALLAERNKPGQQVLLAGGYLNEDGPGEHTYLEPIEAHAWLIDRSGIIIDATAKKIDANSNVPVRKSVPEADAHMEQVAHEAADTSYASAATAANQEGDGISLTQNQLKDMGIAGLGALAAIGMWHELRRRTLLNGAATVLRTGQWLTGAAMVYPEKAAAAMAWHAFSNGKTAMPIYEAGQATPSIDMIPNEVLAEIAGGALRHDLQFSRPERRGIQRLAKLALAERRKPRITPRRKQ